MRPIAIVVPAEPALKKLADSIGVEGHGMGDLVHDAKVQAQVLREMQAVGKAAGLASVEIIQGVVLADDEWTPQNVSAPFPWEWMGGWVREGERLMSVCVCA